MKLRILKRKTTKHFTRNDGSNKYPKIVSDCEVTEEELLQFREDETQQWQDVEVDYEHVEGNIN